MLLRNIVVLVLTMLILTGCSFAEITDLIHRDTDRISVEKEDGFSNPRLNQYKVNGVVFIPYTRQNPFKTYEDKYYYYSLRLASYTQAINSKVVVNCVTIEGVRNVKFKTITKEANKQLEFSNDPNNKTLKSEIVLVDAINDYNMELNKDSQLKVVLNVSVEQDGKTTTRDMEYVFETQIRKYLNQG
jgi:hypothetical protein